MKTNFKIKTLLIAFAYVLLAVVFLISCETKNATIESTSTTINGRDFEIYVIDNCEYIGTIHGSNADVLSHKGNCKFCLARHAK